MTVFFNLFSEAEPFAAILIAHGTHVFWGDSWDLKGRNLRPNAEIWLALSEPPPNRLEGLGECCKLPQWGSGCSPDGKYILDLLSRCWMQFNFLLSTDSPVEPLDTTGRTGTLRFRGSLVEKHWHMAYASFSVTRWQHSTFLHEITSWPPFWN